VYETVSIIDRLCDPTDRQITEDKSVAQREAKATRKVLNNAKKDLMIQALTATLLGSMAAIIGATIYSRSPG
jgi:hypothetical protein